MLLRKKVEIEKWLNKYNIQSYELIPDKEYGYVVNVDGDVDLDDKNLKNIGVKFNIINGYFDCCNNELESLEGCPKIVSKWFSCALNKLTNLINGPKDVNGYYLCIQNKITSLIGFPEILNGNFNCSENKLSIDGLKYINYYTNNDDYIIYLEKNNELGEIQKTTSWKNLKKILTIYQEKADLMKVVEVTDKSLEKTSLLIKVEKLKKI